MIKTNLTRPNPESAAPSRAGVKTDAERVFFPARSKAQSSAQLLEHLAPHDRSQEVQQLGLSVGRSKHVVTCGNT